MSKMFSLIIKRLRARGWHEESPKPAFRRFTKKNWVCRLYWQTGRVHFHRYTKAELDAMKEAALM